MNYVTTRRSVFWFYVLTIITCGIYGIYFTFRIKEDVNAICADDGKHTPGLFTLFFLSLITCGIYSFVWYYNLNERIGWYFERHLKSKTVDGVKYLLWSILGVLTCGLASIYATFLMVKGLNECSEIHNSKVDMQRSIYDQMFLEAK